MLRIKKENITKMQDILFDVFLSDYESSKAYYTDNPERRIEVEAVYKTLQRMLQQQTEASHETA